MNFNLQSILRPNILNLKPYSSARDEYDGDEAVFLDANENPYETDVNRYPDPAQRKLKEQIGRLKQIDPSCIFLGNGSDEPIDLLFRAFCRPGTDNVIIPQPTYGMYQVCADINDIEVRSPLLKSNYQLDKDAIFSEMDKNTRVIFICTPNNPTSISIDPEDIKKISARFDGIVVVDEAYIDFSSKLSILSDLSSYSNLVVLQTFSKAWGLAGIRLGMAFASADIVEVLSKIKYPYNISRLTQQEAMKALKNRDRKEQWVSSLLADRSKLAEKLSSLELVKNILPSDANFLMVKFEEPKKIYNHLVNKKLIVRDRSTVPLCEGYLRFTIGTPKENEMLYDELKAIQSEG
jgi:histidinol-phosphate aminotransferase